MTNFKPNDNLEYIRALTGPTLVKDEEEQPRLPTLILGDGLKLTTNLALRTHRLDVEGGADEWSEHPATQDVDLDGFKITGLGEPTDASDAATKAYVDAQSGGGGPTDRIESPSGEAFVESTDDYRGWGDPASIMRAGTSDHQSQVVAETTPSTCRVTMAAGPDGHILDGAGFFADYHLASSARYALVAYGAPLQIEPPVYSWHAATKGYVDSITGLNSTIAEGELTLTWDSENAYGENVTLAEAGPLRYTRIGRTVTLSGNFMLIAESDGAATAVFTGIAGAALPDTSLVWRGGTAYSPLSLALKPTQIYMSHVVPQIEFTVLGAAAELYRTNFVISYKSAE